MESHGQGEVEGVGVAWVPWYLGWLRQVHRDGIKARGLRGGGVGSKPRTLMVRPFLFRAETAQQGVAWPTRVCEISSVICGA
jgi:hypothetical protein